MGFWNYVKWMCIFDFLFGKKKEHSGHIWDKKQKDTYIYDPDMQDDCSDCGQHDYGSHDDYMDWDFHDYEDYGNAGYEEDCCDDILDDDLDF